MATFGDFPPSSSANQAGQNNQEPKAWERKVLEDLVFAALKEQRTRRRWGYAFKALIFLYLFGVLYLMMNPVGQTEHSTEHTALVNIHGIIAAEADANADSIVTSLRDAFDNEQAKGLIIRMNTPGGSPVQAGIINDELLRLQKERPDFPVYAVVQDICASGGYYIAVAAKEIYADKASIVGSIGVRMDSFGFTGAIEKLGIERRLFTAGEHKGSLDPFLPLQDSEVKHIETMLSDIHQQFIEVVKLGRGDRLVDDPILFSGLFWSGEQAVQLGLIDGLANSSTVARDIIGAEDIVDYTLQPNYLDRFASSLGANISEMLLYTTTRMKFE